MNIAFKFIKKDLDINSNKYESICERNRMNGQKGGRPPKIENPKNPNGFFENPKKPKKPKDDNYLDIVNNNNIINNNIINNNNIVDDDIKETTSTTILKEIYPNLIEDELLKSGTDVNKLIENIKVSRFLKSFNVAKISWFNKHYEEIIAGYYKDFESFKKTKEFQNRDYSKEELNSMFDDIGDISL